QIGNTVGDAASLALRAARMSFLISLALGGIWAALGMLVIRVFWGSDFEPAYLPLVGLLPGMVFLGVQRVCGGPVLRVGTPARITAIYAASLLLNGVLNVWWIPLGGPFGASLASSVSYGVGSMLFLAWTARLAGRPLREAFWPARSDYAFLRHSVRRVWQDLPLGSASRSRRDAQ